MLPEMNVSKFQLNKRKIDFLQFDGLSIVYCISITTHAHIHFSTDNAYKGLSIRDRDCIENC